MSEREYEQFFDLLDKIVNEPRLSAKEKRDRLLEHASDHDRTNLQELGAWEVE